MSYEIEKTPRTRLRLLPTLAGLALLMVGACDLDVSNPNALSEEEALTASGLLPVAVGMQDLFAEDFEEFVQASALATDEWGTGTRSLLSYRTLLTGEGVLADLGIVTQPWSAAYHVIRQADDIIEAAPNAGLAAGQANGLVATARLFKGMALGFLALQFEQVILNPQAENPSLSSREAALDETIAQLDAARTEVAGLTDADISFLQARVLGTGFDLVNTIDAMLARYNLVAGRHQAALEAAQRVDLSVVSVLPFTGTDVNPICNLSQCGLQYVFPLASFVDQAEEGDQRPAFWVDVDAERFTGNPDSLLLPLNQYGDRNDPVLVYVPDEMTLIRAEVHTRLGDFDEARDLINEVRTRATVAPVAGLDPLPESELDTEAELLAQIAYERRYELYQQGLRWEDLRRLSAFVDEEPTLTWLPTPLGECRNNPSLGC